MSAAAVTTAVAVPDDRHVPAAYEGTLEPGYHCLAWNGKRKKYCRARAGRGTAHPGVGRCKHHDGGGDGKVKHGLTRRYQDLKSPRLRELIAAHQDDPDPLDILPELAAARGLFQDFIERYEPWREALIAWFATFGDEYKAARRRWLAEHGKPCEACGGSGHQGARDAPNPYDHVERPREVLDIADAYRIVSEITKIAERIEKIRAQNAITYPQLKSFLFQVERVLERRVPDPAVLDQIRDDLLGIRP